MTINQSFTSSFSMRQRRVRACVCAGVVVSMFLPGCGSSERAASTFDSATSTTRTVATTTTTTSAAATTTVVSTASAPIDTMPDLATFEPQIRHILTDTLEPGFYTASPGAPNESFPSGASIGIRVPGQLDLLIGVGTEAVPAGAAFDPTAPFAPGDVTVNVLYTLVDLLVADGTIDPSATLATWLPEYPNAASITVQMLRDGDYGGHGMAAVDNWLELVSNDWSRTWTLEEILDEAATRPAGAIDDAGGGGDTAVTALLFIIEQATGTTFDQLIRERLDAPLGLADTGIVDPDRLPANFSHGRFNLGGQAQTTADFPLNSYISMTVARSGLISTISDQLTLTRAIATGALAGGPKPTPDRFPSDRLVSDQYGDRYVGAGFPLNLHCPCTEETGGHTGTSIGRRSNAPGTSMHWYYFPETDTTIVVRYNSSEVATSQEIMEVVYGVHALVSGRPTPVK